MVLSLFCRIDSAICNLSDFRSAKFSSLCDYSDKLVISFVHKGLKYLFLLTGHIIGHIPHGLIAPWCYGDRFDSHLIQKIFYIIHCSHSNANGTCPAISVYHNPVAGCRDIITPWSCLSCHVWINRSSCLFLIIFNGKIKLIRGIYTSTGSIYNQHQTLVSLIIFHICNSVQQPPVMICGTWKNRVGFSFTNSPADIQLSDVVMSNGDLLVFTYYIWAAVSQSKLNQNWN